VPGPALKYTTEFGSLVVVEEGKFDDFIYFDFNFSWNPSYSFLNRLNCSADEIVCLASYPRWYNSRVYSLAYNGFISINGGRKDFGARVWSLLRILAS